MFCLKLYIRIKKAKNTGVFFINKFKMIPSITFAGYLLIKFYE